LVRIAAQKFHFHEVLLRLLTEMRHGLQSGCPDRRI
jgi:hypothetical protein